MGDIESQITGLLNDLASRAASPGGLPRSVRRRIRARKIVAATMVAVAVVGVGFGIRFGVDHSLFRNKTQHPAGSRQPVLGIHHFQGSNAAGTRGTLVLRHGCVMLKFGPGVTPQMLAWPSDFSADTTGHGFRILNGDGRVVAVSGDHVQLGGGPIDAGSIGTKDGGNLPSKCLTSHMFAVGQGMVQKS
jgi:hypothetical protein